MNKVLLIGRLTKDPELKVLEGTDNSVATFSLAVDRNYVSQNGQRDADFFNIVCWKKLAEHVANNLTKGRLVGVTGSLQTRKYQAQDGSNRYITEIVADEVKFLDYPNDERNKKAEKEVFYDGDEDFLFTNDPEMPF